MKPSPAAWLGAGLSAGANPPAFPDAADLDSANSAFFNHDVSGVYLLSVLVCIAAGLDSALNNKFCSFTAKSLKKFCYLSKSYAVDEIR